MKQWKNLWGIKMTNNTLKPCPFCGCGANGPHKILDGSLGEDTRNNDYYSHWEVICSSFCTIKMAKTKEGAIKVWNTRYTDQRLLEVLRLFAEQYELNKHKAKISLGLSAYRKAALLYEELKNGKEQV